MPEPNALLTRRKLAEALTEAGYPITAGTLSNQAVYNTGPPFKKFGRTTLYRWRDALKWAEGRTTEPAPRR